MKMTLTSEGLNVTNHNTMKNFFIQATIHVFLRSWSHQNVILDRKQ